MAIKFPLIMSGVEIRTLEDLRKNFELEAAVNYFKSGKLLQWLEDRYYEDEAEKVQRLDKNSPDFKKNLCAALGAVYAENSEYEKRLQEKRAILSRKTSNSNIIENADKTALNQEDLAELLDAGKSIIYLCGENFSVPLSKKNKKYIGILGTPNVFFRASSKAELDANNITFENINPIMQANSFRKEYQSTTNPTTKNFNSSLNYLFEGVFGHHNLWSIFDAAGNLSNAAPSQSQKRMFLKMVCGGEYEEKDLIHICATENFSAGWALTKDSFCVGGKISLLNAETNRHKRKIFYSEIDTAEMVKLQVNFQNNNIFADFFSNTFSNTSYREFFIIDTKGNSWQFFCEDNNADEPFNDSDFDEIFENNFGGKAGIKFFDNDNFGASRKPIIENKIISSGEYKFLLNETLKTKLATFLNYVSKEVRQ